MEEPVWARLEVIGKFNKATLDSINLSIWANALGSLGFMVIDSIRLIDHEDEVLGQEPGRMMSMYCGTCGHHSSMHYFAAPTKNALGFNHGCSTVNTDGRDCMCSGFKKKQYTFSDRVKRYAEQQLARQALFNAKLRRGPRGVGKYWSGKKDVEKNAEDK